MIFEFPFIFDGMGFFDNDVSKFLCFSIYQCTFNLFWTTGYITLRKLPVKISLVIYFPCKIVLIYQECGDSACRSHNEITRQRGQINTIGVGLLRTRNSGKFYTVCVIILHGVLCVICARRPILKLYNVTEQYYFLSSG